MKFVTVIPGCYLPLPVSGYPVPYSILDDQHSQFFQLFPKITDIKAQYPVMTVHIGAIIKIVLGTIHIQHQTVGDPHGLGFRFSCQFFFNILGIIPQQCLIQIPQNWPKDLHRKSAESLYFSFAWFSTSCASF